MYVAHYWSSNFHFPVAIIGPCKSIIPSHCLCHPVLHSIHQSSAVCLPHTHLQRKTLVFVQSVSFSSGCEVSLGTRFSFIFFFFLVCISLRFMNFTCSGSLVLLLLFLNDVPSIFNVYK